MKMMFVRVNFEIATDRVSLLIEVLGVHIDILRFTVYLFTFLGVLVVRHLFDLSDDPPVHPFVGTTLLVLRLIVIKQHESIIEIASFKLSYIRLFT